MEETKKKYTAVCLSAGSGKRMGGKVAKQYLELEKKPIICYALDTFEKSPLIDEIVFVVAKDSVAFAKKEIVEKYGYQKIKHIVVGGSERFLSVQNALQVVEEGYVLIHDGARPFVTEKMLEEICLGLKKDDAVCVGVPVKDTIKVIDEEGYFNATPDRARLYAVQTPQAFLVSLIKEAYAKLEELRNKNEADCPNITDDAMVVETMLKRKVKMIPGSYENIKITTPEDLEVAKVFLNRN